MSSVLAREKSIGIGKTQIWNLSEYIGKSEQFVYLMLLCLIKALYTVVLCEFCTGERNAIGNRCQERDSIWKIPSGREIYLEENHLREGERYHEESHEREKSLWEETPFGEERCYLEERYWRERCDWGGEMPLGGGEMLFRQDAIQKR
eukprot:TRINITY_DN23122_c0_g1_i1.p1 TRINITY_DN23122_c0_g1~~TRINITY_DN23122_c0_g1_i1.p1  ORF type:complete len:156 (+),score=41.25 TRINITY_DN23122_c0_g1_i1:26-469(+)